MLGQTKALNKFLRYTIGLVFMLSGLIKLNDPVGFSWILEAYVKMFAIDFMPLFLKLLPWCLPLAIGIAVVELVWGIALVVGFRLQLTVAALLCLTTFFTWLTFYTALFRRMGSCGCFGDLIMLTPWQSFWKSAGLCIALYSLYKQLKPAELQQTSRKQGFAIFIGLALGLGISGYACWSLPMIDWSMFKKGANLHDIIQNESLIRYTYPLKGSDQQLEDATYAPNATYKIGRSAAARRLIPYFSIWNEQGEITNQLLQGDQLLIIVQSPSQLTPEAHKLIEHTVQTFASGMQLTWLIPVHAMRSTLPVHLGPSIAFASPALLRALLKNQVGFFWLKDGILVEKGSIRALKRIKS
jgi:uncharacterized membrane protein YphA (DoxX/SURF4 family)